jgi:hypothetical protein
VHSCVGANNLSCLQTKVAISSAQHMEKLCESRNRLQWIDTRSSIQTLYLFTILYYLRLGVVIVGTVFLCLVAKELRDAANLFAYARHVLRRRKVDVSTTGSMDNNTVTNPILKMQTIPQHATAGSDSSEYGVGSSYRPAMPHSMASYYYQHLAPKLLYGRPPEPPTGVSVPATQESASQSHQHNVESKTAINVEDDEDDEQKVNPGEGASSSSASLSPNSKFLAGGGLPESPVDANASANTQKNTLRRRLMTSIKKFRTSKGNYDDVHPSSLRDTEFRIGDSRKRATSLFQEHRIGHSSGKIMDRVDTNGTSNADSGHHAHSLRLTTSDQSHSSLASSVRSAAPPAHVYLQQHHSHGSDGPPPQPAHESFMKDWEDLPISVKIRLLDGWRILTAVG